MSSRHQALQELCIFPRRQTRATCASTFSCRALPTSEWYTTTCTQTLTHALCCAACSAAACVSPSPCSQAVLLSEKRGKERAARLAAARAGKPAAGGKPKKSEEQKKVARDFYNQVGVWLGRGLHVPSCSALHEGKNGGVLLLCCLGQLRGVIASALLLLRRVSVSTGTYQQRHSTLLDNTWGLVSHKSVAATCTILAPTTAATPAPPLPPPNNTQMIVDSEYQGEDYEQFDRWLGVAQ